MTTTTDTTTNATTTQPQPHPTNPRLLPVATGRQARTWATHLVRQHPGLLTATLVAMAVAAGAGLASPLATGEIVQALVTGRGRSAAILPAVELCLAVLIGAAATRVAGTWLARLVLPGVADLREQVLAAAVVLPVDVAEAGGAGDLLSRVCGDVEQLTEAAQDALGSFVAAALAIGAAFIGLAALDWRFLLAAIIAVPVQLWTLRWYLRTSRPVYAAGRAADGRRTAALLGTFAALPTVRALRLGPTRRAAAADRSLQSAAYEIQATRLSTRFFGRLNCAEFIGLGAILAMAGVLVRDGQATVGSATSAALFFAGLFGPINTVLGVFDDLQQAGAGLARLLGVRDRAAPIPVPPQSPRPPNAALLIDSVSFTYSPTSDTSLTPAPAPAPDAVSDAVSDITLRIEPGQHVAVVGVSGSGKSTLAGLVAGLYQPGSGTITVGGTTPSNDRVALVAQQPHVFAGTVADNLRLAAPAASDDEVNEALTRSGAATWVTALPQGSETLVGAGGRPLTTGQAQHLALARLLLLDPEFVVLDEATAEGGSETARVLDEAARTAIDGRGALLIAHRLSQAAAADRVIVMRDARVVEAGTHEELVAAGGAYAGLWEAWAQHQA
jgi:ATP-binding cassette, subfamily C, bacterial